MQTFALPSAKPMLPLTSATPIFGNGKAAIGATWMLQPGTRTIRSNSCAKARRCWIRRFSSAGIPSAYGSLMRTRSIACKRSNATPSKLRLHGYHRPETIRQIPTRILLTLRCHDRPRRKKHPIGNLPNQPRPIHPLATRLRRLPAPRHIHPGRPARKRIHLIPVQAENLPRSPKREAFSTNWQYFLYGSHSAASCCSCSSPRPIMSSFSTTDWTCGGASHPCFPLQPDT